MGSEEVIMRQLALLFAVLAVVTCYRSYHGYKVLRTEKLSMDKMELLKNFQIQSNLDFWREPWLGQPADIMVPASKMTQVQEWLTSHNIKFSLMVENVQELVELSQPKNSSARGMFDWTDYYPHEDLNTWIAGLADANDFARIINIGKSYEGRDMNVLAIEKAGAGAPNVWLEAGIHAREWISPAVATYIVNQLLENNSDHPDYLDKINWYFIPSANPDGYTYTFETDRMWRKTRSPQGGCIGVDPNRNWDFHWGESGVSNNPCTEVFPGDVPFLRLKQEISVTLCKLLTLSPSFHTASIHTPSFGSGHMATTMTHTPRTERSWSKWPLMPVMLYTLSMEQSLTQSTQLISTLLLELQMIGTRVFWDQDLLLQLNSETQADMDSCSLQIRLLNQEKKFGLPWM